MTSGTQPSRVLLIAAGVLTQLTGAVCLVLALAALPIAHDLRSGTTGVVATAVAALAALVCGPLIWRGRLVPLALAAGIDLGLAIGLPRGGSAIGALLRILPSDELHTAETLITVTSVIMFAAAALCIIAVPSALKLRRWARAALADEPGASAESSPPPASDADVLESAPTRQRPRLDRPSAGSTLKGIGPVALRPTQVIRTAGPARSKPLVIASVALTLIALGIILVTALSGSDSTPTDHTAPIAGSGSAGFNASGVADLSNLDTPVDAAPSDAPSEPPPLDDFVTRFHAALASGATADLAPLFAPQAFAFGVGAHDLAEGRDAVVAQLQANLGEAPPFAIKSRFSHVANEGEVGWLAEQLVVGDAPVVLSAALSAQDGAWTIAALHWAQPMANPTAYRLAREGELAIPDAIPDAHDESPLAAAMRTAFSTRAAFVDALSTREDAFNFGSAGERLFGGATIRKVFGRLPATVHLHDAVKVGALGADGGWGVANVEFTDADRDGTEITQTFRVLTIWLAEDGAWHIVQTQWSNAR